MLTIVLYIYRRKLHPETTKTNAYSYTFCDSIFNHFFEFELSDLGLFGGLILGRKILAGPF